MPDMGMYVYFVKMSVMNVHFHDDEVIVEVHVMNV
jgi:hypothetical protein